MPDDPNTPPVVADPANPSGNKPDGTPPVDPPKDTVKYESYAKLLDEKKKLQQKFDDLAKEKSDAEAAKQKALEDELKAKDDWKKLVALREQELETVRKEKETLKSELTERDQRRSNGLKMRSFLDALSGDLDEQYWSLVDLDKVVINPETGMPEATSASALAQEFATKFPLVIQRKDGPRLPNHAPQGAGAKLTYDAWQKLPLKEQLERMKDVDKATM